MENFAPLIVAVLALMGTPGPVTLASAASGAAFGLRAFPYVAAMTAGTATVMLLVATGITGIVAAVPGVGPVIAVLAGSYIIYLAVKIAMAPPLDALDREASLPPLVGGYAMAVMNPKAYGAMAALFSGFPLVPDQPLADATIKVPLLTMFALIINSVWMLSGTALALRLRDPSSSRMLNIAFAVLLVGSVLMILL